MILNCIENWAELYSLDSRGKETNFLSIFSALKSKEIEFPPSFFLQPVEPIGKNNLKKDLHRVRKLLKEFIRAIKTQNKERAILIKKIVNSYKKTLEFEINFRSSHFQEISDDLNFTLSQLKEAKKFFDD